ncbi:alpha/beta fold hydrolase [Chengkuizengella axinellae]|uniref:Alpha/beta hydrolase n=1 Tax=Chengkuizengella axinellae TaxID=3064388 RepID=A0ABT9J4G4_9BACL|nr:alpha/beta hydrolase [Chengkuizengella sp. 2205SS18-9]MDP5276489.1 alpha/beta hydrolase [Chengkuizengella sp. 2205SS18-9]
MNGFLIYIITIIMFLIMLFVLNRIVVYRAETKFPSTGEFIEVDDIKLHYYKKGDGRPVIFLHGGILCAEDFNNVLDLAKDDYQVIAFDRMGYGYSQRSKKEKITPMVQADILHKAIKKMNIKNPILVGHSWSGLLVLSYALNYPKELAGIVLLAPGAYAERYPAGKGDLLSKIVITPIIGKLFLHILLVPLGQLMVNVMLKPTFKPDSVPLKYQQRVKALWLRPNHFKANREDIISFVPAAKKLSIHYHKINVPTQIVIGEKDPFDTKEDSYQLYNDIPHSNLIECPNAGHMLPQAHPKAVIKALEKLFNSK